MRGACLCLWLGAAVALAAPPEIRLPTAPKAVPAAPRDVTDLPADHLFIVDADTSFLLFASPKGLVTVTKETGPLRFRGKFAGGNGQVETREFKGKFIAIVEPVGRGDVELLIVPEGAKSEADAILRALRVDSGQGPRPPPKPVDPPEPPGPIPNASPFNADGLHVLILYDPKQPLPAKQISILDGAESRKWLEDNCAQGPRNKTYRIWPVVTDGYADSQVWGDAAKRVRTSLPWVIVGNRGKGGYEGVLPDSVPAFLELVNKYK